MVKGIASTTGEFNNRVSEKIFYGHYPAGSSIYNWIEINQMLKSQKVQDKDYGDKEKNKQVYGQEEPPELKLEDVTKTSIPMFMIVGKHDVLIAPKFSRQTRDLLKERLVDYVETDGGHNAFMVAKDVSAWSSKLTSYIREYNK